MARTVGNLAKELDLFLKAHLEGLDTKARVAGLSEYVRGLGLEGFDKSMAALARKLDPENVEGCRQRMQRAVAKSKVSHTQLFERLQKTVAREASVLVEAFCIDDTGFAKQGDSSVGVQRQYSGTLGKIGNCQVTTTLHAISNTQSFCIAAQLYLPRIWTEDEVRRKKAQIPKDVQFRTKQKAALDLLRQALAAGIPKRPVLADAGYGEHREFRDGILNLGLDFLVGVSGTALVWRPGAQLYVPVQDNPKGGPPFRRHIDANGSAPISVIELSKELVLNQKFRKVTWRQGTKGAMSSKFARLRVRSAEGRTKGKTPSEEMWLVVEQTSQPNRPFKYYFCSLPEKTPMKVMVNLIKMRWRIEKDYRDMKQHLGLDQYEGRNWGGFHRHFAMVALMHAFIALHRERFSPRFQEDMELESVLSGAQDGPDLMDRPVSAL